MNMLDNKREQYLGLHQNPLIISKNQTIYIKMKDNAASIQI